MFRMFAPELARAFIFAPAVPRSAFNFSLHLGAPGVGKDKPLRRFLLEGKSLSPSGTQVRISDGPRSLQVEIRPTAAPSNSPFKIFLTTKDETSGSKEVQVTLPELIKLEMSGSFKALHSELLRWLQETSPDLFGGLAGKEYPASTAPASSHFEAPVEGDERGTPPAEPVMKSFVLACDDAPDLSFEGRALAAVVTPYRNGRAHAYSVFETKAKRIVAVKTGLSLWPAERPRQEVKALDTLQEITGFFGFGPLAKHLYDKLGLQTAVTVE